MTTLHFTTREHVLNTSYIREYPRALAVNQNDVLKLHIKQYLPKKLLQTSKRLTIIGAHANAFPKELYEPFWDELYSRCSAQGYEIASVWIADVAWQGQSSVLNEGILGNDPGWFDHSRDLLHMINTFQHEMTQPIIGIGHSMGGCQMTNLALFHPRLFAALVLMDPVISPGNSMGTIDKGHNQFGIAWQSTYRKDIWSSREEAAKSFQKSPFYQSWDPRVLDLWIKYGLRDLPTALYPESSDTGPPAVTLTTSRPQEVWSFLRPNYDGENEDGSPRINKSTHPDVDPESKLKYPFYRPELRSVYLKLPSLRPPTFYIMGGTSNLGSREFQREKVPETGIGVGGSGGEKEGKVGHVFLKGIGHLVPMEAPILSAEVTSQWIRNILAAWFEETEEFEKSWSEVGKRAKIMLNKSWFDHIGPRPSRSGRKHKL